MRLLADCACFPLHLCLRTQTPQLSSWWRSMPRTRGWELSSLTVPPLTGSYIPVPFFSRRLTPAERNVDNREHSDGRAGSPGVEALAGGLHLSVYCMDGPQESLLPPFCARRLNSPQARWALFLGRFNFSLTYWPGSRNTKPDALSRQFALQEGEPGGETILPSTCVVGAARWEIEEGKSRRTNPLVQENHPDPEGCPPNRLYVPPPARSPVLQWGHPLQGSLLPWFPSHSSPPAASFSDGPLCPPTPGSSSPPAPSVHPVRPLTALPPGLLRPLPVPHRPWSHIAVDFVMGLPPSEGNTTILTIVDRFSKVVHFIPLSKLPSALETAALLVQHVFCLHINQKHENIP